MVFAGIVCGYGLTKLRKVQRVSMWGEAGRRGRNWRVADAEKAKSELEMGRQERIDRHRRLKEDRLGAWEDMRAQALQQKHGHAISAAAAAKARKF